MAWNWYTPRTFLLDVELLYPVFETLGRALLGTALPAVALALLVFALCRSAVGRALALTSIVAVALYTFYGVRAPFVWEFFYWRASAVLALTAVVVGFSLAAPLLAASWLRLSWAAAPAGLPADRLRGVRVRAQCHGHRREPALRDLAVAGGAGVRDRSRRAVHRGLAVRHRLRPARDRALATRGERARASALRSASAARDRAAGAAALDRLAARAVSVPGRREDVRRRESRDGARDRDRGARAKRRRPPRPARAPRAGGRGVDRDPADRLRSGGALRLPPDAGDPGAPDPRCARALLRTRDGVPRLAPGAGEGGRHRLDPGAGDRLRLPLRRALPLPELRHELHPRVPGAALGRVRLHAAVQRRGG